MRFITCRSKIYDNNITIAGKGEMEVYYCEILFFLLLSENIIYWLS